MISCDHLQREIFGNYDFTNQFACGINYAPLTITAILLELSSPP